MSTLGDRMKEYEAVYDVRMPRRLPVIVRVDGKRFSKYTKKINAEKPFDETFSKAMATAAFETAQRMEGCVFAYTQSDEITYVIRNDQSLESEPWLGNRIQKINSIAASMTTAHFAAQTEGLPCAYFDSRVFVVPSIQEAMNTLVWRQNDAVKNSISAACYYEMGKKVGRKTARKEMHGLNQKQQQELLFTRAGINWNDYPIKYKRGIACYRVKRTVDIQGVSVDRSSWIMDEEIPIFSANQEFLEQIISEVNIKENI